MGGRNIVERLSSVVIIISAAHHPGTTLLAATASSRARATPRRASPWSDIVAASFDYADIKAQHGKTVRLLAIESGGQPKDGDGSFPIVVLKLSWRHAPAARPETPRDRSAHERHSPDPPARGESSPQQDCLACPARACHNQCRKASDGLLDPRRDQPWHEAHVKNPRYNLRILKQFLRAPSEAPIEMRLQRNSSTALGGTR